MFAPRRFQHWECVAALIAIGGLANLARAANEYFDVNGVTTGSGVTNGGSYSWEGANFNSVSTGLGGPLHAWPNGNSFFRLSAGTDAIDSNFTITASSNHTFAGMALQADGGGTVTIATSGAVVLTLNSNSNGQGFFVGGFNTQNLRMTATIGGDSITPLVWQGVIGSGTAGTLSLYGNNTFSGGVDLNATGTLNFNNANSFGTGPIRWSYSTPNTAVYTLAAPTISLPLTITNPMVTKAANTLTMTEFAQPVMWSGAWTLASGTSTLDIRSNANTTISGIMSGSGGALAKTSTGTLTLTAANTYTGGTTISNGTLELSGASARLGTGNVTVTGTGSFLTINNGVADGLNNAATLNIANGGLLNLAAGVNERVISLSLDTVFQPNGTYGSSQSNAANKFDDYFTGTGILTIGPPILAGDFSSNSFVDAADYVTWRENVGQPSQTLANDTTGAITGDSQYFLWRSNFANTTAVPGSQFEDSTAVPEPASAGLLIFALATLMLAFRGINGRSQPSSHR
jgi:autotransporter-associated beta strand protein/T5SS/PEP-CTERM-associated repeat protein